jgi:hypothetical protein
VTPEGRDAREVPGEMPREVSNALSLLLNAARIDPVLMDAARKVDRYIHDVQLAAIFSAAGVEGPGVVALVRGDDGTVTIAGMERRDWWWEDNMPVLSAFAPTVAPDDPSEMPLYRLVDGTDS